MRLLAGAEVAAGSRAADALLCVSGSHPARRLPGLRRWAPRLFASQHIAICHEFIHNNANVVNFGPVHMQIIRYVESELYGVTVHCNPLSRERPHPAPRNPEPQLLSYIMLGIGFSPKSLLSCHGRHVNPTSVRVPNPSPRARSLRRLLPDSFELLKMASRMRQSGELPPQLALAAAENPLLDPASRLERKVRPQIIRHCSAHRFTT